MCYFASLSPRTRIAEMFDGIGVCFVGEIGLRPETKSASNLLNFMKTCGRNSSGNSCLSHRQEESTPGSEIRFKLVAALDFVRTVEEIPEEVSVCVSYWRNESTPGNDAHFRNVLAAV